MRADGLLLRQRRQSVPIGRGDFHVVAHGSTVSKPSAVAQPDACGCTISQGESGNTRRRGAAEPAAGTSEGEEHESPAQINP
jgi:hypothetical protein